MITKVLVVTHKEYSMPDKELYFPVCVGHNLEQLKDKFQPDNVGENISEKNSMYSELTALYWAWKNLDFDVLGMVHYRRHLTIKKGAKELADVLDEKQIDDILKTHDVIVAWPRRYIETVKNHYIRCEKGQKEKATRRIAILGEVIKEKHPDYSDYFEKIINGHKAHMFNIFIMKKQDVDQYCEWLFDILFETEKRIDAEGVEYPRGMGELSEFLLDVWIKGNKKKCYEARVIQYGYNLFEKIKFVIRRRFFGEKVK